MPPNRKVDPTFTTENAPPPFSLSGFVVAGTTSSFVNESPATYNWANFPVLHPIHEGKIRKVLSTGSLDKLVTHPPVHNKGVNLAKSIAVLPLKVKTVANEKPSAPTTSYWDWPVDAALEKLGQDEKVRSLFSADHITANLVAAAAKYAERNGAISKAANRQPTVSENDLYWSMKRTERQIVQNDLTCVAFIEASLVRGAAVAAVMASQAPVGEHHFPEIAPQQDMDESMSRPYWDWPAWKTHAKEIKEKSKQERLLHLISTRHIIETLISTSTTGSANDVAPGYHANDGYWMF